MLPMGREETNRVVKTVWSRDEVLADRLSSKSRMSQGLPRTMMCLPRTSKWSKSPVPISIHAGASH